MLKLRFWLIILIGYLFLLFNIERIDESIDIASFVYVLVTITAGATLLLWRFAAKIKIGYLLVPIYIVYFALKIILDYQILGENTPITIIEILSILITLLIVREISFGMLNFEETIQNLTFRQIGLPPRLYETTETEELYREVKRSRRFQHPLTVVAMKPGFDPENVELSQILIDLQKTMASRYLQARLAKLLSETLRDYDLVAVTGDEFVILLPETSKDDAEIVMDKIQRDSISQLDIQLDIGVAQFPESGVTLTGLVETARDNRRLQIKELTTAD